MDEPVGHYTKWNKTGRNTVWSHLYVEPKKVELIETELNGGYQGLGDGILGKLLSHKIQIYSYKMNKFWGSNV